MKEICLNQGSTRCISRLAILFSLFLSSCNAQIESSKVVQDDSLHIEHQQINDRIIGDWICVKELWRNRTKYGKTEVNAIRESKLVIDSSKIYLSKATFIDTLHYSLFKVTTFFENEGRNESSYIEDGPLSVQYSDQELSQFKKLSFQSLKEDEENCLDLMYFKDDSLILKQCGGVVFFFVRQLPRTILVNSIENPIKNHFSLSGKETEIQLELNFYSEPDKIILRDQMGKVLYESKLISTNEPKLITIQIEDVTNLFIEIVPSTPKSKWDLKLLIH